MRSIKTMLLLAFTALTAVAFTVPAMASASNWKQNGEELNGYTWSQEGKTLESTGSLGLSGTIKFPAIVGGRIECPLSATASLEPARSGKLSAVAVSAAGCKMTGSIAQVCSSVSAATTSAQPWSVSVTESGGKPVITSGEVSFFLTVSGSKECPQNWRYTGKLTATPNDASAISSVSLSGAFKAYIDSGGTPTYLGFEGMSGTLNASPAGKYGISKQRTVAVSGNLGWESGTYGTMDCPITGTVVLSPGSEGQLTSLSAGTCQTAGWIKTMCGSSGLTFNSTPALLDQGATIAVKGMSVSVTCAFGAPFTGDLVATPDSTSGVSYTSLSGTLNSEGINMKWSGKLNWAPAGVYGL
jgi:hypothetical protein